MASASASLASSVFIRRDCIRSSAATVWRLFFTRWWTSRIVASLVISSRSLRRSSVTSRTRMTAPVRRPSSVSGTARRESVPPRACMSERQAARPMSTSGSDSSTGLRDCSTSVDSSARVVPVMSPSMPKRWKAERAFGEVHRTTPASSSSTTPSPTRGAPRRGGIGAPSMGNAPFCSMRSRRAPSRR